METKVKGNKLLCLLLTVAMLFSFVSVVDTTEAFAATGKDATTGFYVDGTKIRDANGNNFIMRGVNHGHAWFTNYIDRALTGIADAGSNAVRLVCEVKSTSASNLESIIQKTIAKNMIPIVEVHDATGSTSTSDLNNCVNYWVRSDVKAVLQKYEKYVILNIANEWGGNGTTGEQWASAYTSAVSTIRNAGIHNMLMVDCTDWGHGGYQSAQNCQTIFNADVEKNTMFSIHMYEYGGGTKGEVKGQIDAFLNKNVPIVVGEFGQRGSGHTEVDYIMEYCQQVGVGYLAWSWQGNTKGTSDEILDMTTNWGVSGLTEAGKKIVNGTYGIKNTSVKCSLFGGSGSDDSSSGGNDPTATVLHTWTAPASDKASGWYSVPTDDEYQYSFGAGLDLTTADKAVFTVKTLTDNEWTNGELGFGSGADYKWTQMAWDCQDADPGEVMKEIEPGVYQITIDGIKAAGGIGDGADCMFKIYGFNRVGAKNNWLETTIDLLSIEVFDSNGNSLYKEGDGSTKPVDPSSKPDDSSSKTEDSSSKTEDSSSSSSSSSTPDSSSTVEPTGDALFTWTAPAATKQWYSVPTDDENQYAFGADLDLTKADKAVFTLKTLTDNEWTNGELGFGSGADYTWTQMAWDCQEGDLGEVMPEIEPGVYQLTIDGIQAAGGIGDGATCMFKIYGFNRTGAKGAYDETTIDLMNLTLYDAQGNVIYKEGGSVVTPPDSSSSSTSSSDASSGDDSQIDPPITGNAVTVWSGNLTIPNWKDIPPLSIANCVYAQEGGKLRFTYAATADATSKKLPEVQFTPVVDNQWLTMEDHLNEDKDVFSMPLKGTTYTTAALTAEEAYNLKYSERFMIKGQNCELKKIEYILAPGQTLKSGEEKTIWTGKFSSMAGWSSDEQKLASATTLGKMNFKENGILRIYFTSDETSTNPAQVQLVTKIKSADWNQVQTISGAKDFNLTVSGTYQDILLTAEQAEQLASAKEFWMKANICEVTKITYRDPNVLLGASGDIGGGDDSSSEDPSSSEPESSEDPDAAKTIDVYEGALELGNWAGYEEGIVFDDLKVGDVIKFTVKDVTSTDSKNPAKVTIQDSDWNDIDCIGYPVVTKAQPYAYVEVTQDVVDALLNNPVILKGCFATLTNVQVLRNQTVDIPSSSEEESSSDSSSDASSDDSSDVVVGDETVIIDNYPQFDGGTWGEKEYSFNVPTAGKYVLKLQFQGNADAYFKMKLDGVENNPWAEGNWVGDTFGGNEWSSFGTKEATVELTAGTHTITVEGNNYAKYGLCTIAPVESHTHKYTATVTKAATCTEDGVMTYTCECGDSYTEVIKATGHKYVETIVAPTTTEQGYTLHKCSVCGHEYKDNFTDPVKEPTTLSGKVASQYNTSGDLRFIAMIKSADAAGADVAYYDLKVDGKLVERVPVTKTYKSYVSNGKTQQAPAGANFIITKNLSNLKNGQKATFELYFSNFDYPLTRTITVNK